MSAVYDLLEVRTIKILPKVALPIQFTTYISDKFEYKDPWGEHIYSPESIAFGTHDGEIPQGEPFDAYLEVREILKKEKCDYFTLTEWKPFFGFNYLQAPQIRLLVVSKNSFPDEFIQFAGDKFEYKDPMGDHLFSLQSIWLKSENASDLIKDTMLSLRKTMNQQNCSLFTMV